MTEPRSNEPSRTLRTVVLVLLALAIVVTIGTYYDALAQYTTGDQLTTLRRFDEFARSPFDVRLTDGSNISRLLFAVPGRWLDGVLAAHGSAAPLVGNLHYTRTLSFALLQTTTALALRLAIVLLTGAIAGWRRRQDAERYLLFALFALNLPLLKGLCKVLKYDCLSILFQTLALLAFVRSVQTERRRWYGLAIVLCALAFLEKDTTFPVVVFIVGAEGLVLLSRSDRLLPFLGRALGFIAVTFAIYVGVIFALAPALWRSPSAIVELFGSLSQYGLRASPLLTALLALVVVGAFYARAPATRLASRLRFERAWLPALVGALVLVAAVAHQRSDLYWPRTDAALRELAARHIVVGPRMADVQLSTMDTSVWLTRGKFFFSELRIFVYTLPELVVLALFVALPLRRRTLLRHRTLTLVLLGFTAMSIVGYALLLVIIEAKYLVPLSFLLVLVVALFLVEEWAALATRDARLWCAAVVVTLLALVRPMTVAGPAHFGYVNAFRSVAMENSDMLDLRKYPWLWPGWGESNYRLYLAAARRGLAPATIACDTESPFYRPPGLGFVDASLNGITTLPQLRARLRELEAAHVDYLIVSKNQAYRRFAQHYLAVDLRPSALLVDDLGGVEFSWLFRVGDLVKRL